jgi:D-glycero-D-manno-heptose 1,7-bisphosphate phosphatase
MRRAVFIDRDGVINRKFPEGQYVTSWEQMELLPGVPAALRELRRAGFVIVVATNQSAVGRQKLTAEGLEAIHRRMLAELAREGAIIDAVYCPHDGSFMCECRKPRPGMLLLAAKEHAIDLSRSWMVGDAPSDIQAGQAAGCRTVWLAPRRHSSVRTAAPDLRAGSLTEAVTRILKFETGRPIT